MHFSLYPVLLLTIVAMAEGIKIGAEKTYCEATVDIDLEVKRLKGVWWEKESFNTDSFVEYDDKCHVSSFYPTRNGKKINVISDYMNPQKGHMNYTYVIFHDNRGNDGDFHAIMNIKEPPLGKTTVDWDILETDYDNFILARICYDGPGDKEDFKAGMLLVRNATDDAVNTLAPEIFASILANGLDHSYFQTNHHFNDCPPLHFPATFPGSELSEESEESEE